MWKYETEQSLTFHKQYEVYMKLNLVVRKYSSFCSYKNVNSIMWCRFCWYRQKKTVENWYILYNNYSPDDCSHLNHIREDAYWREAFSHGIRHGIDTAYSLWFNDVWPYASLNHNEYAVSRAVSRMKMPPVREYASSLLYI